MNAELLFAEMTTGYTGLEARPGKIRRERITWATWDQKRRRMRQERVWRWIWTEAPGVEWDYDTKAHALYHRGQYEAELGATGPDGFTCPECDAAPGEPCFTVVGEDTGPHSRRVGMAFQFIG
jgi:hypothetical protein